MTSQRELLRYVESDLRSLVAKLGKRKVERAFVEDLPFLTERFSSWKSAVERVLTQLREDDTQARLSFSLSIDLVGHVLIHNVQSVENWRKSEASTLLALGLLHRLASQAALPSHRVADVVALLSYFVLSVQKLVLRSEFSKRRWLIYGERNGAQVPGTNSDQSDATDSFSRRSSPGTVSLVEEALEQATCEQTAAVGQRATETQVLPGNDLVLVERQLLRVLQVLFEIPSVQHRAGAAQEYDVDASKSDSAASVSKMCQASLPQRLFTLLTLIEQLPGVTAVVARTAAAALERYCTALFEDRLWREQVAIAFVEDLCLLTLERPPVHGFGTLLSLQVQTNTSSPVELPGASASAAERTSSSLQQERRAQASPEAEDLDEAREGHPESLSAAQVTSTGAMQQKETYCLEVITPSPDVMTSLLAEALGRAMRGGLAPQACLLKRLFPFVEAQLNEAELSWSICSLAAALIQAPVASFGALLASLAGRMLEQLRVSMDPSYSSSDTNPNQVLLMHHRALLLIETFRDALLTGASTAEDRAFISNSSSSSSSWSPQALLRYLERESDRTFASQNAAAGAGDTTSALGTEQKSLPSVDERRRLREDVVTSRETSAEAFSKLPASETGGILTQWVAMLQLCVTTGTSMVTELQMLPTGPLRHQRPLLRQLGQLIEEPKHRNLDGELWGQLTSAALGLLFVLLEATDPVADVDFLRRTWPDFLTAFGALLARAQQVPAVVLQPLIERGMDSLLQRLAVVRSSVDAPSIMNDSSTDASGLLGGSAGQPPAMHGSTSALEPFETVFICLCRTLRLVRSTRSASASASDSEAVHVLTCLGRVLQSNLQRALSTMHESEYNTNTPQAVVERRPLCSSWSPNTWLALVESILIAGDDDRDAASGEPMLDPVIDSSFEHWDKYLLQQQQQQQQQRAVGCVPAVALLRALFTVAHAAQEDTSTRNRAFLHAVFVVKAYLNAVQRQARAAIVASNGDGPYTGNAWTIPTSNATNAAVVTATGPSEWPDGTGTEQASTETGEQVASGAMSYASTTGTQPPFLFWQTPVAAQVWDLFAQFVPMMASTDHVQVLNGWRRLFQQLFLAQSIDDKTAAAPDAVQHAFRPTPQAPLFAPLLQLIEQRRDNAQSDRVDGAVISNAISPLRLFREILQLVMTLVQDYGELFVADGWYAVLTLCKEAVLAGHDPLTFTSETDRKGIHDAGFALLQLLAKEYASSFLHQPAASEVRTLWLETLTSWALHAADVNMALSSIGMLWSLCDLLQPSESTDAALWCRVLSTLARLCITERVDVRNSALKTFLGTLLAHGQNLVEHDRWRGIWEEALLPLIEGLLVRSPAPSSLAGEGTALEAPVEATSTTTDASAEATAKHAPARALTSATTNDDGNDRTIVKGDAVVGMHPASAKDAIKHWNASRLLLIEGLVRLIQQYLVSRWLALEAFPRYWESLLDYWEQTSCLYDVHESPPSNQEALLIALVALWQTSLETLSQVVCCEPALPGSRSSNQSARQLWLQTWQRAQRRAFLANCWPRFSVSVVESIVQALLSLCGRVQQQTPDVDILDIVQSLGYQCLEALIEDTIDPKVAKASSATLGMQRGKPVQRSALVRDVFDVLARWPGDSVGVHRCAHLNALLSFLERICGSIIRATTGSAAGVTSSDEHSVMLCIVQGTLERLVRGMPPSATCAAEQEQLVLRFLELLASILVPRRTWNGSLVAAVVDGSSTAPTDAPAASAQQQPSSLVSTKHVSGANAFVESAVFSLAALVDKLEDNEETRALLTDAVLARIAALCERFLFEHDIPLPESFDGGTLHMIHTGQLDEEKCSIVMLQLGARLGLVDLLERALGLAPDISVANELVSVDEHWFLLVTSAYRFNLRLAAIEALFHVAAGLDSGTAPASPFALSRLASAASTVAAARVAVQRLMQRVERCAAAYRRQSGCCPLPYLMRMFEAYVRFQADALTKRGVHLSSAADVGTQRAANGTA